MAIGVEDYFALPDVPYADRDATAVYRHLLRTRGVPTDRAWWVSGGDEAARMAAPARRAPLKSAPAG